MITLLKCDKITVVIKMIGNDWDEVLYSVWNSDGFHKFMNNVKKEYEKNIGNQDYVIAMDIDGKIHNSEELAELIDSTFNHHSTITFIIGSSYGLHQDIKDKANLRMSFSKLTFPHGLFRGILLEQIYRSFKILNNESYHK